MKVRVARTTSRDRRDSLDEIYTDIINQGGTTKIPLPRASVDHGSRRDSEVSDHALIARVNPPEDRDEDLDTLLTSRSQNSYLEEDIGPALPFGNYVSKAASLATEQLKVHAMQELYGETHGVARREGEIDYERPSFSAQPNRTISTTSIPELERKMSKQDAMVGLSDLLKKASTPKPGHVRTLSAQFEVEHDVQKKEMMKPLNRAVRTRTDPVPHTHMQHTQPPPQSTSNNIPTKRAGASGRGGSSNPPSRSQPSAQAKSTAVPRTGVQVNRKISALKSTSKPLIASKPKVRAPRVKVTIENDKLWHALSTEPHDTTTYSITRKYAGAQAIQLWCNVVERDTFAKAFASWRLQGRVLQPMDGSYEDEAVARLMSLRKVIQNVR